MSSVRGKSYQSKLTPGRSAKPSQLPQFKSKLYYDLVFSPPQGKITNLRESVNSSLKQLVAGSALLSDKWEGDEVEKHASVARDVVIRCEHLLEKLTQSEAAEEVSESALKAVNAQLQSMRTETDNQASSIKILTDDKTELQGENEKLKRQILSFEKELKGREQTVKLYKDQDAVIQGRLKISETNVKLCKREIERLNGKIIEFQAGQSRRDNTIQALRDQKQKLQTQDEGKDHIIQDRNTQLQQVNASHITFQKQLMNKEQELNDSNQKLLSSCTEKSELKRRLEVQYARDQENKCAASRTNEDNRRLQKRRESLETEIRSKDRVIQGLRAADRLLDSYILNARKTSVQAGQANDKARHEFEKQIADRDDALAKSASMIKNFETEIEMLKKQAASEVAEVTGTKHDVQKVDPKDVKIEGLEKEKAALESELGSTWKVLEEKQDELRVLWRREGRRQAAEDAETTGKRKRTG